ncbi:MAG: hypothetical protein R2851_17060 [Caldilineaceae bacterium]
MLHWGRQFHAIARGEDDHDQPRPDLQAVVDDFAPLIETAADTLWDFAEVR